MRSKQLPERFLALLLAFCSVPALGAEWVVRPGETIQDAINQARAGDTVLVMPGTYEQTVYIDRDGISLVGVIENGRRAIMDGEGRGLHDGIIASGHGINIEGFHVRNYRSNGITTQGANNFRIHNNIVENIHLYGIFPQFGKNGLVSQNIVSLTSDAGIYVGMSENVDIIANEVFDNSLGIEAENSHYILIESNYAHDNTEGIPIVIIPGLQTKTGADVIVRNNTVINNNSTLFDREGAVASLIKTGRGISVTAVDRVTIEGNIIKGNKSCGICVSSMSRMASAFPVDAAIDPEPDEVRILRNVFVDNGLEATGLEVAGATLEDGADIVNLARGSGHCIADRQGPTTLGTGRWGVCDAALSTAEVVSYQLEQPIPSPELSFQQKAQLTYHAVCSGCHAYGHTLIGPPVAVIQALYKGKPEDLAAWIAAPTKKRPADQFPAMPPQDYLAEDLRLELARYILDDVGGSP